MIVCRELSSSLLFPLHFFETTPEKQSPRNKNLQKTLKRFFNSNGRRRRFRVEIWLRRVNGFGDAWPSNEHSSQCSPQKALRRRFPPLLRTPNQAFSWFVFLWEINYLLKFLVSFSFFCLIFNFWIWFLFLLFRFIGWISLVST